MLQIADIAASVLEREKARIDAETDMKLLTLGKELAASEMHSRRLRAQMDAVIAEGNSKRMRMLKDGMVEDLDRGLRQCFQPASANKPVVLRLGEQDVRYVWLVTLSRCENLKISTLYRT